METIFGGVEKPISPKGLGQLKILRKCLGDKTPQVIGFALNNWATSASKASTEAGTESWAPQAAYWILAEASCSGGERDAINCRTRKEEARATSQV